MRHAKGSTPIKLLIAVAIIAILAAIFIINSQNARSNANAKMAQAYVRNVVAAMEAIRKNNGGYLSLVQLNCEIIVNHLPVSVQSCVIIAKDDKTNFTVSAVLRDARYTTIEYDSSTGQFTFE